MKQQNFKIGPCYKVCATGYNVSSDWRRFLFFSFIGVSVVNAIFAVGMDIYKRK